MKFGVAVAEGHPYSSAVKECRHLMGHQKLKSKIDWLPCNFREFVYHHDCSLGCRRDLMPHIAGARTLVLKGEHGRYHKKASCGFSSQHRKKGFSTILWSMLSTQLWPPTDWFCDVEMNFFYSSSKNRLSITEIKATVAFFCLSFASFPIHPHLVAKKQKRNKTEFNQLSP